MSKNIRPLYDCTVLLGGSRDNSVFVPAITAAEMNVLRVIHGANESGTNPITNVVKTGKGVDRSDAQERARIGVRYNAPGATGGIAILNALYGVGNKLPLEYEAPVIADHGDGPLLREEEAVVDLATEPAPEPEPVPEPAPEPVAPERPTLRAKKQSVLDEEH